MTGVPPPDPLPVPPGAYQAETEWEVAAKDEERRRKASDELERHPPAEE